MRSLPGPGHPVLLCCACSSTSVPSSQGSPDWTQYWAAAPQEGGKITPFTFWVHICSQFSEHVFAAVLLSRPSPSCHTGLLSPRCRHCICLSWKSRASCQPAEGPLKSSLPSSVTATLASLVQTPNSQSTLHSTNQAAKDNIKHALLSSKLCHR